jgi:hypothetical protein
VHAGSKMAKFMAAHIDWHMAAVVRILAYIKKDLHCHIVFDRKERDFMDVKKQLGEVFIPMQVE